MNTDDTGYITEPDMLTSAESDSIHFKDMSSPVERVNLSEGNSLSIYLLAIYNNSLQL